MRSALFWSALAVSTVAQATAAAPVYISQHRLISAVATAEVSDVEESSALGVFNATVDASRVYDLDDVHVDLHVTGTLESNISDAGILVSGLFTTSEQFTPSDQEFPGEELVGGGYQTSIHFELLTPHHYTFSGSLSEGSFSVRSDNAVVTLSNIDVEDSTQFLFGPESSVSGILEPGEYRFGGFVNNIEDSFVSDERTLEFQLALLLEPVVIPLPAALWPGLAMLGALVGKQMWKRRVGA